MALLREAARSLIRKKLTEPSIADRVRSVVSHKAPQMPLRFKTPAQVARFKRAQRDFDQVLLDLAIASPQAIQERNSIASLCRPT